MWDLMLEVDLTVPMSAQEDGAARIINPLKNLSIKEGAMMKEAMEQLKVDTRMGSELGKVFKGQISEHRL